MRNRFDEQLAALNRELIRMGALCEEAIAMASKALVDGDIKLSNRVVAVDSEIDEMEREIESLCLKLLLQLLCKIADRRVCEFCCGNGYLSYSIIPFYFF